MIKKLSQKIIKMMRPSGSTDFDSNDSDLLVVGLGNPGSKYRSSPHNVGRACVESLPLRWGWSENFVTDRYAKGLLVQGVIDQVGCFLLLPETYMNLSGQAVVGAIKSRDLKPKGVVVIHDDLDLKIGQVKVSFNRGPGGHNGVQSIIDSLKTKGFIRIRIGVGSVEDGGSQYLLRPAAGYGLGDHEDQVFSLVAEIVEFLARFGLEKTMNKFN